MVGVAELSEKVNSSGIRGPYSVGPRKLELSVKGDDAMVMQTLRGDPQVVDGVIWRAIEGNGYRQVAAPGGETVFVDRSGQLVVGGYETLKQAVYEAVYHRAA